MRRGLGDGPLYRREQGQQADGQQQEQGNAPAPWKGCGHSVARGEISIGMSFLRRGSAVSMKNEACRLKVTGAYRYSRNAGRYAWEEVRLEVR